MKEFKVAYYMSLCLVSGWISNSVTVRNQIFGRIFTIRATKYSVSRIIPGLYAQCTFVMHNELHSKNHSVNEKTLILIPGQLDIVVVKVSDGHALQPGFRVVVGQLRKSLRHIQTDIYIFKNIFYFFTFGQNLWMSWYFFL